MTACYYYVAPPLFLSGPCFHADKSLEVQATGKQTALRMSRGINLDIYM
jgi:hypothetical protein